MPDKIVWNDFKQALPGPKGEGQEARNNDEHLIAIKLLDPLRLIQPTIDC